MADPVKTDEIEDVLSSIRRLVSEHHPIAQNAPLVEPIADTERLEGAEKLVLTPALRVTDPEDPWVPITARGNLLDDEDDDSDTAAADAEDSAAADDLPHDEATDWAVKLWGDDSADADADLGLGAEDELHADDSDDEQANARAEDALASADDARQAEGVDGDEFIAPTPDDDDAEPYEGTEDAPLSFIRSSSTLIDYEPEEGNVAGPDETPPIATLDLAEARAAQQAIEGVLTEVSNDNDIADAEADIDPAVDGVAEAAFVVEEDEAVEVDDAADVNTVIETAVDSIVSEIVDDTITDFLAEPVVDDAAETVEDSSADDQIATVEDLGESPFTFPDYDDGFVDEDALREMIVEVVREELQGEMGKRITRNVRKLVRREIRIALAADDPDD